MISSAAARFSGLKTSSNREPSCRPTSSPPCSSTRPQFLLVHILSLLLPPRRPHRVAKEGDESSGQNPEAESDDDARYVYPGWEADLWVGDRRADDSYNAAEATSSDKQCPFVAHHVLRTRRASRCRRIPRSASVAARLNTTRASRGWRPPTHSWVLARKAWTKPTTATRNENSRSIRGSQAMSAVRRTNSSGPCRAKPTARWASSAPWPAPKM